MEIFEECKEIPVKGSFDVVVMGGGPSGVSAAIAAARMGVNVALIERYGYLGGQATGGLVIALCGLSDGKEQIIKGICQQVIEEVDKLKEIKRMKDDVIFDPETMKYVLDKLVLENKIRLYLHSMAVDVRLRDDEIAYLIIESKSGRFAIKGKIFIDATGDGDSAKWCNIEYNKIDKEKLLPVTLAFRLGNVKVRKAKRYLKAEKFKTIKFDDNIKFVLEGWQETTNKSEVWFDAIFIKNIDITDVDDLTYAELASRKYIHEALKEIKKIPGFEDSYLQDTASQIGGRESRHIKGLYTLTKEDLNKDFPDSIARARNYYSNKGYFKIPYRCLLSINIKNLLFAGRCISVSRDVFDAIREIPCCMATGEAAGTSAGLCILKNKFPKDIDVKIIQQELLKRNALI